MRNILLTVTMALFGAINMWGAKANSTPMSFTQPDGTTITVVLRGDENAHWFTTTDGVILSRQDKAFYLAEAIDGELRPTNVLAHNKEQRQLVETLAVSQQDKASLFNCLDAERERNIRKISISNNTPAYFAHTGSPKALVILAEYSDCPFTLADPQKSFEQVFNAEGENNHVDYGNSENRNYMSVREYFNKCSRGLFTPEFVISEPVKVGTMDTYGGSNENSANDENPQQLLKDAMAGIEGKYDLTEFDNDGDGRLDLVYIIYSGYGQNNGAPGNTVWAKTGSTSATIDGIQLTWYSCAAELNLYEDYFTAKDVAPYVEGIGLICHEFSHALGLPDVYPTSSSAYVDNQEMEYWDLMDGGEYVGNGYRPKDYTAWECEVMGWYPIEEISEDDGEVSLTPLLDGGKAYKFCNPSNQNEYFVMENIQKQGLNKSIPGHGLLVYHVKYPYTNVYMSGCPNNTKGKPGMAIVPADGACLSSYIDANFDKDEETGKSKYLASHGGDPFPGTSNVTALSSELNLPNYCWYDGDTTVKDGLSSIAEDTETGIVTVSYHKDIAAYNESIAGIDNLSSKRSDDTMYDITGRRTDGKSSKLIIKNNKKYIIK